MQRNMLTNILRSRGTYLLQEAEKLKHENEELRKLGEDAVLDQQLNKALQETDKLKLAADAYKKELLQQKVSELQTELAQTNKRLKAAEEQNTGDATHLLACITERHACRFCCVVGVVVAAGYASCLQVLHTGAARATMTCETSRRVGD